MTIVDVLIVYGAIGVLAYHIWWMVFRDGKPPR